MSIRICAFCLGMTVAVACGQSTTTSVSPGIIDAWRELDRAEPEATQRWLTLHNSPDATIALLDRELQPIDPTPELILDQLAKLDSDDPNVWMPAMECLEYQDPRLIDSKKWDGVAQAMKHSGRLLEVFADSRPEIADTPGRTVMIRQVDDAAKRSWFRADRALYLLRALHRPAAEAIIDRMSEGRRYQVGSELVKSRRTSATTRPITARLAWDWQNLGTRRPDSLAALLDLAGLPEEAIPFLRDHLPPLQLDDAGLQLLLSNLASEDESVWRPAREMLSYFDPRLATDFADLWEQVADARTRRRLVSAMFDLPPELLVNSTILFTPAKGTDWPMLYVDNSIFFVEPNLGKISRPDPQVERGVSVESDLSKNTWQRAVRAIALLEHFHRPDATQVIRLMSGGNPEARPTIVAVEALRRLAAN